MLEQIEGTTHFVCVVFSYYLHTIDGKYEAAAFKYGISVKNRSGGCIYVFAIWRNVAAVIGVDGGVHMWFIVPMWSWHNNFIFLEKKAESVEFTGSCGFVSNSTIRDR